MMRVDDYFSHESGWQVDKLQEDLRLLREHRGEAEMEDPPEVSEYDWPTLGTVENLSAPTVSPALTGKRRHVPVADGSGSRFEQTTGPWKRGVRAARAAHSYLEELQRAARIRTKKRTKIKMRRGRR